MLRRSEAGGVRLKLHSVSSYRFNRAEAPSVRDQILRGKFVRNKWRCKDMAVVLKPLFERLRPFRQFSPNHLTNATHRLRTINVLVQECVRSF